MLRIADSSPLDKDTQPHSNEKVAIVTGASDGVGYWTALGLADRGYHVIMACRNVDKALQKKDEILFALRSKSNSSLNHKISVEHLDLSSRKSVESFAKKMLKYHNKISLLINNAGTTNHAFKLTDDGIEETMQVNYVSPFLLTNLLFPSLVADGSARIIQVGSFSHTMADSSKDLLAAYLSNNKTYTPTQSYSDSKLAAMSFCFELAKRIEAANLPIISLCVTPGASQTKMVNDSQKNMLMNVNEWLTNIFGHSAEQGAESYFYAVESSKAKSGGYYGPSCLFGLFGPPAKTATTKAARDPAFAAQLWLDTEKLLGITFDVNGDASRLTPF